jgi:hypothetical protein
MQAPPNSFTLRRRSLRALAALAGAPLLAWTVARSAGREAPELRVITGPDSASSRQILQALKTLYPGLQADADPAVLEARRGNALYLAIGQVALRRALGAELKGPLISAFTSSQHYRQLAGTRERNTITAIYAEAAPSAQMQLINALYERRITVGVLTSEASAYMERPFRQAAQQAGLELAIERVEPSGDAVRALTRLGNAQALLALPDSTLYTPDTLRSVLESTYRRGMPVIGFSAATVAAGTLATAYCAIDDVVADLAELIDALSAPTTSPASAMPEPRYPHFWRVIVNDNVARSLGAPITDKVRKLGNQPNLATGRPA